MAKTYIKLGPIGDAFASNELGIYLNPGDAYQIDDVLMQTRLKSFFKTGFLVEISKIEYDNIIIRTSNARNIPLLSVSVTESPILEPVESVLRIPPTDVTLNRRYLVYPNADGPWKDKDDYIASFTGTSWVFRKPEDKMILPVYAWGVSLHYTGTYPSGKWDYDAEQNPDLTDITQEDISDEAYAYDLFAKERQERIAADLDLADLISKIQNPGQGTITATQVGIQDVLGYFDGTNVEIALIELAVALNGQGIRITKVEAAIQDLKDIIKTLKDINNPTYKYEGNIDNPTTIDVGGIKAGSIIQSTELTDLLSLILNPFEKPFLTLNIGSANTGETYFLNKGDNVNKVVNWNIGSRSDPITLATISNVTSITPALPGGLDILIGERFGTAAYVPNNVDGSISLDATTVDGVESKQLDIAYLSPVLFGYDDLANLGKTGTALWTQLTQRVYEKDVALAINVNFANKYLIIAVPTRYTALVQILDDSNLNNINAFNKRTGSLTSTGLGNNFTESYEIYEAKYIGSSIGLWKLI